ncbi:spore wall protein 2-like [Haliotis rufescens]|uniref:spore wall protein 2-like n=1 Tax=Haliotis rufescens TaxID=6454 RepID=UPI00201E903F|nr:spore wall protein 2-like [Haliotis rufescens]
MTVQVQGHRRDNDTTGVGGHRRDNDTTGLGGHRRDNDSSGLGGHRRDNDSSGLGGHRRDSDSTGTGGYRRDSDSTGVGGHRRDIDSTGVGGHRRDNDSTQSVLYLSGKSPGWCGPALAAGKSRSRRGSGVALETPDDSKQSGVAGPNVNERLGQLREHYGLVLVLSLHLIPDMFYGGEVW